MKSSVFNCMKGSHPSRLSVSRRRRGGQALVEFAFISTIFLGILLGLIQFGVYLNATNSLWNLAREGARFAVVQDPKTTGSDANIRQHIRDIMPSTLTAAYTLKDSDIQITPVATARTYGTAVTVLITYDMTKKLFIPVSADDGKFPPKVFGAALGSQYTTRATMMMETGG